MATSDPLGSGSGTWHYGLIAQWWADKVAEPQELAYYSAAIHRYGEPALDLGCGSGRLLVPLLAQGLDVDGVDISDDMLHWCRERAAAAGVSATLWAQAMHQLDLPRRYRTIFICDSFEIGGSHSDDREKLRRIHEHLEPGGALVFTTGYSYADEDEWRLWLPQVRQDQLPEPWPESGGRKRLPNGDELELRARLVDLDPRRQRLIREMSARLVRNGEVIREEVRQIAISLYFEEELRLALSLAGFVEPVFEARYSGRPATVDDGEVTVIALRSA